MNPLKVGKAIKELFGLLDEVNTEVQKLRPDLTPKECREITGQIFKEMTTSLFTAIKEHPDRDSDQQLDLVLEQIRIKFGPVLMGVE